MPAGSPLNTCTTRIGYTANRNRQPWLFPALGCRQKTSLVTLPSHSDGFYPSIVKQYRKTIQTDPWSERKMEWQVLFFLSYALLSNGVYPNLLCMTSHQKEPCFQLFSSTIVTVLLIAQGAAGTCVCPDAIWRLSMFISM